MSDQQPRAPLRLIPTENPRMQDPPQIGDAVDLALHLMDAAEMARAAGWQVNLAMDTGGGIEAFTFSAERRPSSGQADG